MIDVLKWDAAPRVFAYRYEDCQLNYKSQLIVTESQEAVLVKEGLFYGPIGPGRHTLETKNFPFLTKMISALTTNHKTPYTAEVWFLQKSVPLDMKWGTADPILVEDPKYHIALPIRSFGQYGIRIADSCRFLARLMGRLPAFTEKTLAGYLKGVIITRVKDAIVSVMGNENCSLLQIGSKLNDVSTSLEKKILAKINALNIGPQGFGGKTTALAVHIEYAPTHIAGLPVAMNINCHVARHAEVIL